MAETLANHPNFCVKNDFIRNIASYVVRKHPKKKFKTRTETLTAAVSLFITNETWGQSLDLLPILEYAWDSVQKTLGISLPVSEKSGKRNVERYSTEYHDSSLNVRFRVLKPDSLEFENDIWKYYFAALYAVQILPTDEFEKLLQHILKCCKGNDQTLAKNEHFYTFLFGFFNTNVSTSIASFTDGKTDFLKNKLNIVVSSFEKENIEKSCLYEWAYEVQSPDICKAFRHGLSSEIKLNAADSNCAQVIIVAGLSLMIKTSEERCAIEFVSFNFEEKESMRYLISSLPYIHYLTMDNCQINPASFRLLSEGISNLTLPMLALTVKECNLLKSLKYLGTCLHNINELSLICCDIDQKGCHTLASAILKVRKTIKLDLYGNAIDDHGVKYLSTCLKYLEELSLMFNAVTEEGAKHLAACLKRLDHPIKINLSGCNIFDEGLKCLSTHADKIAELDVEGCGVTEIGTKHLSQTVRRLKYPMNRLNISGNPLQDGGVAFVSGCLSNIRELTLRDCNVTSNGCETLATGITELHQSLEKLVLTGNDIGNEGVSFISKCISNMGGLDVSNCGFTSDGAEALSTAVKELHYAITSLLLEDNAIGDKGVKGIASCLYNIKEYDKTAKENMGWQMSDVARSRLQSMVSRLHAMRNFDVISDTYTELGKGGGKLQVDGSVVRVPPGALDEEMKFQITSYYGKDIETSTVTPTLECRPYFKKFKKSVSLSMPNCMICDQPQPFSIWASNDGLEWQKIGTLIHINQRRHHFTTNHFTWFRMEWLRSLLSFSYKKEKTLICRICQENQFGPDQTILKIMLCDNVGNHESRNNKDVFKDNILVGSKVKDAELHLERFPQQVKCDKTSYKLENFFVKSYTEKQFLLRRTGSLNGDYCFRVVIKLPNKKVIYGDHETGTFYTDPFRNPFYNQMSVMSTCSRQSVGFHGDASGSVIGGENVNLTNNYYATNSNHN